MGQVKGNSKKKRKVEKKGEESSLVSGSSEEGSAEWWDSLSRKIAGNPSSSKKLDMFKSAFKMSRETFIYICSLVKEHMMTKTHFCFSNSSPMSVHDQVALALTRLGSGSSLISIGDSFGAHHSTVSQVTWSFVEAIEETGLHHIQWPATENKMAEIKHKFEKTYGLPNCCGVIDTTHIKMLLTSSDQEAETWLDYWKNHSMILQAIVDPGLRFRDIVTGWPGRMSDSSVLQSSNFFKLCQKGERLNGTRLPLSNNSEVREYIVGDSGFPLLPWLVTPYQEKELLGPKVEFNKNLLSMHNLARKAFARLKDAWKMIQGEMWRPDKHKLPRFILVCCILHNIVLDMEDEILHDIPSCLLQDTGVVPKDCESVDKNGLVLRDTLSAYLSERLHC